MTDPNEPPRSRDDSGEHELLPDVTADDRDMVERRDDDWYADERPPHHG
ncbi:MAG: hypothetical protein U0R64_07340 [Candidatus Nanopelagicales bacterium]